MPAGATGIPAVGPWALALLSFLVGLPGLRGRYFGTAAAARHAR
ncbi:IPTL-CTERM sorting domain-containing protein [Acidovorax delafieldii]